MKGRTTIFSNLDDACRSIGIEANSRRGSGFIAANIVNDRHGKGDGRIKYFQDGTGGYVYNHKTQNYALFFYDHREGQKVDRAVIEAQREETRRRRIRCHTTFRHPFNFSWSGKTCDIRRSSKTTS